MSILDSIRRALGRRPIIQTAWSCAVYYNEIRLVIHSQSRTHNNRGWYNQPVWSCERGAPTEELGWLIRDALNRSVWDSREDDSMMQLHPLLDHAEAQNWDDLERRYSHLLVDSDRQSLVFQCLRRPQKKSEGTRGFVLMKGDDAPRASWVWDCEDRLLGERLLEVMHDYEAKWDDRRK